MTTRSDTSDLHYETHVFCCVNQRAPDHPRSCCSARGSRPLRDYMKSRAKELGLEKTRINMAGCLERCELGPTMVIYPEGIWYTYDSREDVDEILERHLLGGKRVERLLLEPGQIFPKPKVRQQLKLAVSGIERLTLEIRRFELVSAEGGGLPPFEAGAHIDVFTGNGLRRSYSLANDPEERHRYVIGVLREENGSGGSCWMHDKLAVGDVVSAMPPLNNFALVEDARRHVLIAGGIGITPILAMGYRLSRIAADVTLHYCTKSREETAFLDEVERVFGENVVIHHDGGDPSKGIDLDATLAERTEGDHLYICGPSGLLQAARKRASHWPGETVHYELFVPRAERADWANDSFDIVLSRRKTTLTVAPDKSILEVVREHGIDVDSSCESGICGTCRTRLLGGAAEHRDDVLTDREKAENSAIMVCISRARNGETLILDL